MMYSTASVQPSSGCFWAWLAIQESVIFSARLSFITLMLLFPPLGEVEKLVPKLVSSVSSEMKVVKACSLWRDG